MKPLTGVRVVELPGLAPVPFCGQILSDFGADVTVVKKKGQNRFAPASTFQASKNTIELDFKKQLSQLQTLCLNADVILDPFRPNVLESIGLDPIFLMNKNPKLIFARITGYGQNGPWSQVPGHDINYVAMSGMLPTVNGQDRNPPYPPANLLADFAGGALSGAFAITAALFQREKTGKGCIIDVSMTDGVSYLGSFISHTFQNEEYWTADHAMFSGKFPLYRCYACKDGLFVAIGALEPKFNECLFKTLNLENLSMSDAMQRPKEIGQQLENVFATKTRDEWVSIFENKEACLSPVLNLSEVKDHPMHLERQSFFKDTNGVNRALPAPRIYSKEQFEQLPKSKL
uniref:Alpha-methylacyl-CoA racemase n=1 Tax=Rhabditophanes sp. KR3021 TaxID=114890 RepID=A0AC35TXY1_9BILA